LSVLETSLPPQLFDAHGKKIFEILKETSLMDLEERTLKVEACMDRPDSMQTRSRQACKVRFRQSETGSSQ
jgi:hypothetical protein